MTATKKTATKKTSTKKGSKRKAKKRPARKASSNRPSTKAKRAKKSTARKTPAKKTPVKKSAAKRSPASKKKAKKSATKKGPAKKSSAKKSGEKKSTAKKSTAKKSTAKKSTAKKSTAKKSTAKKTAAKRAAAKKSTAKKMAVKKQRSQGTKARKTRAKKGSSRKSPKRAVKPKVVAAVESSTVATTEKLDSIIDKDLLENFEGWETPEGSSASERDQSPEGAVTRAEREADFDELLEGEKAQEDWTSTGVFESDVSTEGILSEAVEENVTVTSLVVVQEARLAPVQECRIEQPKPDEESEFEEFAAEEIISILDESLAMDLEAAAQAEPKDEEPGAREETAPPQALQDEVEAARPQGGPQSGAVQRGFFARLWRLLISSE